MIDAGGGPRTIRPGYNVPSSTNTSEAEVFHLEIFVDTIFRTFAAKARFLDAAKGCDLGRDEAGVDADDPIFERLRNFPHSSDIAAIEIGSQTELGIVCESYGVRFGFEAEERRYRSESFFPGNRHCRGNASEDRRLEEASAQGVAMPTNNHGGAFRGSVTDVFFDFVHRVLIDQRSLRGAGLEAASRLELQDDRREFCGKGIVHAILHEEAIRANTGLTGVSVFRGDGAFDGGVEIGVVKNDKGSIAAKFER